jgi:hypothetical protein
VINLLNIFYIFNLKINLLFGAALCKKGLRGSFNKHALYIYNHKGSLVLKAVKQGGIYIVNRITSDLEHSAFPITSVTAALIEKNTGYIFRYNTAGVQQEKVYRTSFNIIR